MAKTFMVHAQVPNIVPTLYSIAFPKFHMEATAIVNTGAILEFVLTSNVCVDRHPIVPYLQTNSV